MSSKKQKKFGNIKIAAVSLQSEKDGWLTKQGGSIKTWKKRYFKLKESVLFYFKTPGDQEITGRIDLDASSHVQEEPSKGKKGQSMFSVSTANRIFYMFPEKPEEMKEWVDAIKTVIEKQKSAPATKPSSPSSSHIGPSSASTSRGQPVSSDSAQLTSRDRIKMAKSAVKFLNDPSSKVLEFWGIWNDSIPDKKELANVADGYIEFQVAISADSTKLTWRVSGPQNTFIQRMVDFFWNVGAPEGEIDRLNDVGAGLNPERIGSWIDMSNKGGMDGGWFFPVKLPLEQAFTATDKPDREQVTASVKTLQNWLKEKDIAMVTTVGRDMGAAPPRQTEMRFKLPGMNYEEQLEVAMSAWTTFGIPQFPEEPLRIMKQHTGPNDLTLSVVTSVDGFVKVGILVPKPSLETVLSLCKVNGVNGNKEGIASFEGALGKNGPDYVEYQHLMKGYGYGVYKEGFDIVLHYDIGQETFD